MCIRLLAFSDANFAHCCIAKCVGMQFRTIYKYVLANHLACFRLILECHSANQIQKQKKTVIHFLLE